MNVRVDLVSVVSPPGSRWVRACAVGLALGMLSCRDARETPSPIENGAPAYAFHVKTIDRRFDTRDAFIAAVEMQLSGEPFARAMGRDLGGYTRDYACQGSVCTPSVYLDPAATAPDGGVPAPRIDLAGFSSAIESYEYSKQPMNDIAFESGAGTSLLFGPVLNPGGRTGASALALAQDWMSHLAVASNASRRVIVGSPPDGSPLGWPGLWPTLQPFSSWDPSIRPTNETGCSLSSDDNPSKVLALTSDVYECDCRTLNLPDRAAQVTMTIGPGPSGWAEWKEALWALNYLQLMHDVRENPVDHVTEERLGDVGVPGNTVGSGLLPGTYIGSSDIEGFQAGNFIQILDNAAAEWLSALSTADGATLGGFASVGEALAYQEKSPLRWFPASIAVTEAPDESGFPRPTGYSIDDSASRLLDLAGLLGAYASLYALTDLNNAEVGGSQPARVYFDGDPFPTQNQTANGEATIHDRALAMMRVLVVDIDRLHVDAVQGLFADEARAPGGKVARGRTLSSDVAAYALLALRTARRSLDSELSLYGNTTPDTRGIPCPLDAFRLSDAPDAASFGQRLDALIELFSALFYDRLTTSDGEAFGGWDASRGAPADDGTTLDGHTAAIRGLLTAYLATGATRYRDRAERVWQRLDDVFHDDVARVYRATAGDRSTEVTFTPRRFGLLQAALRDTYELVARLPGREPLRTVIEERVGRLNKLVLNGWDDRNRDGRIEWPDECAHLGKGPDGKPLGLGGLQMAERTLSGDTGSLPDALPDGGRAVATDREHDCVPEISAVGLPSALARSLTFSLEALRARPRADAGDAAP